MPQMDFTTFFPQVFWLILLTSFFFMFFLRGFFSTCITILKLRGIYLYIFVFFFKSIFKKILVESLIFIKIISFKYISILNLNNIINKIINKYFLYFYNIYIFLIQEEQHFQYIILNSLIVYFEKILKNDSFSYYYYIKGENDEFDIDTTENDADNTPYVINFLEFLTSFFNDKEILSLTEFSE